MTVVNRLTFGKYDKCLASGENVCVREGMGIGGGGGGGMGGGNITHSAVEASTFTSSDISLDVSGFWVLAKHFCRFRIIQASRRRKHALPDVGGDTPGVMRSCLMMNPWWCDNGGRCAR